MSYNVQVYAARGSSCQLSYPPLQTLPAGHELGIPLKSLWRMPVLWVFFYFIPLIILSNCKIYLHLASTVSLPSA